MMLDELELAICKASNSISIETLQDVIANFIVPLHHLHTAGSGHIEKIVIVCNDGM